MHLRTGAHLHRALHLCLFMRFCVYVFVHEYVCVLYICLCVGDHLYESPLEVREPRAPVAQVREGPASLPLIFRRLSHYPPNNTVAASEVWLAHPRPP